MFLLIPSGQLGAMLSLMGAIVSFYLSTQPMQGPFGFTYQQWGIICLVMAF